MMGLVPRSAFLLGHTQEVIYIWYEGLVAFIETKKNP